MAKVLKQQGKVLIYNNKAFSEKSQEKTVTPSVVAQEIIPDEGFTCLSKVTVEPVTSAIDSNITAENIKKDINILGVVGTLESGGSGEDLQSVIDGIIGGSSGTAFDVTSSATSIQRYKFEGCKIVNGNFPNATSIGSSAFSNCNYLENINLPNVTSVGESAFFGCNALKNLDLPNATTISQRAFRQNGLNSINISNVTSIPDYTFENDDDLTSISLPNATSIGQYAFSSCTSIKSIVIPKVTSIKHNAFSLCTVCDLYDFRGATAVPTLSSTGAFWETSSSKKIVVPDALYDEWITATNWSSNDYKIKSSIIKASEYEASL